MSFILDALRKSEHERQRQAGPALFEVKVAPPRLRFPLWGVLLGVLLGANLIVLVVWLLMRGGSPPSAPAVDAPAAAPPAVTAVAPPVQAATSSSATAATAAAPTGMAVAPATVATPLAAAQAADPRLGAAAEQNDAQGSSADNEPAVEPAPLAAASASHVTAGPAGLPSREEAIASSGMAIPALRLDLHVYAADPRARYVLINMRKLRETDSLPDGVKVDRITESGVELSYRGTRFTLPRE
ncbi:MAG TPA: general secretion pathway protein GspB [Steroidobacteraceae bacterium]